MVDTKQGKQNPEAGESFNWRRPSTYPWLIFGLSALIGFILGFSIRLEEVTERVKFIAGNVLSVLALIVIIGQSRIYSRQTRIMGVTYDPRLQITSIKVASLEPDESPIFMLSIKNIGATDAVALLDLRVSFGKSVEGTLAQKLSEPQTVTIPAGQEHTYAIPWDGPIKTEHIERLHKVPLKVSGSIKLAGEDSREFCYRYYAIKGDRPPGLPEFVPCDFSTKLTRVVTPGAAGLNITAHAPIVVQGEVIPAKTGDTN